MAEDQYSEIANAYSSMSNPAKLFVQLPMVLEMVGGVKGKKVLDLACGSGFYTRIFSKQEPGLIVGVDKSKEMIEIAEAFEQHEKRGIQYVQSDAIKFKPITAFDVVTAVFLLNYASTKYELFEMCKKAKHLLRENDGIFCGLTESFGLKLQDEFHYNARLSSPDGKKVLHDGDRVKIEFAESEMFSIIVYYWSKETYEKAFENAGFKSFEWVHAKVSDEVLRNFEPGYWNYLLEFPNFIAFRCTA